MVLSLFFIPVNLLCMAFLLWAAFAKVNRPISWGRFNFLIAGAFVNLAAVIVNAIKVASLL